MTRTTPHPAIMRARQEGFLRVRTYRYGSSVHTAWWKECERRDHVFVLLVEKPTCSRLIVDTYTRTGVVSLADRIVADIENWANRQYGKRWPRWWRLGESSVDLDQLDPEDAAEYAADLARVINTYPDVNTVDDWPQSRATENLIKPEAERSHGTRQRMRSTTLPASPRKKIQNGAVQ
jgi:hypothetical protein